MRTILQSIYKEILLTEDNDEPKSIRGHYVEDVLKSLEEYYNLEADSTLSLTITLGVCNKKYGQCLNFTKETFEKTVDGLFDKNTQLERRVIRKGSCTNVIIILDKNLSEKDSYVYKYNTRKIIEPDGDHESLLKTYGYIPTIEISELIDCDDDKYDTIESSLTKIATINENWKIEASMIQYHKAYNDKQLRQSIIDFLWNDNHVEASNYIITLTYKHENGQDLPILSDIESVLQYIAKHGWNKDIANVKLASDNQRQIRLKMWEYLHPILEFNDRKRAGTLMTMLHVDILTFSQLVPNPTSCSATTLNMIYDSIETKPYACSRKLDGFRGIIAITLKDSSLKFELLCVLTSHIYEIELNKKQTSNLIDLGAYKLKQHNVTLFDCEFINKTCYIFDVMEFCGEKIIKLNYDVRLKYLESPIFRKFIEFTKDSGLIMSPKPVKILTKQNAKKELMKMFDENKNGLHYDGMILTPINDGYYSRDVYKIKPTLLNTIDFLLKRIDNDRYVAYTWIQAKKINTCISPIIRNNPWFNDHFPQLNITPKTPRAPIPFATAINDELHIVYSDDNSFDDKIVECVMKNGKWVPLNIRKDKTLEYSAGYGIYGNGYYVAYGIYTTIVDEITPENLLVPNKSYFKTTYTGNEYDDFLFANRIGKAIIYEFYISPYVPSTGEFLEISGGRGSDVQRAFYAGIRNYFVTDSDINALMEYEQRGQTLIDMVSRQNNNIVANIISDKKIYNKKDRVNMKLYKFNIGEDDPNEVINKFTLSPYFPQDRFKISSMQFAIHYACKSEDTINDLLTFLKNILSEGGKFVCTFYDGNEILKKLKKIESNNIYVSDGNGSLIFKRPKDDHPKFSIQASFNVKSANERYGLEVKTLLKTISNEPIPEYLVFPTLLKKTFENDFIVEIDETLLNIPRYKYGYFKKKLGEKSEAKIEKLNLSSSFSDIDFEYLSMIRMIVFKKKMSGRWKKHN
jgi:hypothetical protein